MPVLDATFLVDLQRNRGGAHEALKGLLEARERLLVPAQAATEFLAGLQDAATGLRKLEESYEVVLPGRDHVLEAARLAREAMGQGNFPAWPDVLIAATATLEGTYVVTANPRHFTPLGCEAWDYRSAGPRRPGP